MLHTVRPAAWAGQGKEPTCLPSFSLPLWRLLSRLAQNSLRSLQACGGHTQAWLLSCGFSKRRSLSPDTWPESSHRKLPGRLATLWLRVFGAKSQVRVLSLIHI